MKKNYLAFGVIFFSILLFFLPFFLFGKLPIPSDTIIGLYHPFRDLYVKEYPNGIPYKNFLITDPVRQQYPWRSLVVESLQRFQLPLWNPYNFSGTPLLGNIQSATFYPLNLLFFLLPFWIAWSLEIVFQPLLAAIFLYFYLRNLRIGVLGSILGSISFAFSGFFTAWLEWGTVLHVALWLPLILFSIDKMIFLKEKRNLFLYSFLLLFSICASFFAGHLQTFFYILLISISYLLARLYQHRPKIIQLIPFGIVATLFILITAIQWYPTLQLILLSARDVDQADWTKVGWFIPWQHMVQFWVPDFFGNPATLNYWSDWNYAEFVGYIGIAPLFMAFVALFYRRDKKTLYFGILLLLSLLFAFPTPLAKLPFIFSLPFISTAQPTRLMFVIDFSLAVLAAFGLDYYLTHTKRVLLPFVCFVVIFLLLWGFVLKGQAFLPYVTSENLLTAKRNLVLPTIFLGITVAFLVGGHMFSKKKNSMVILAILFIGLTLFDLYRFQSKFTPFTDRAYLFPSTKTIAFLQNQKQPFRYMTTDSQVLPPNFSSMYHLQSVDGYDPIYLRSYAELIAASERKKPNISPPFGFNRIITPHTVDSSIMDLLNVVYVVSLTDIPDPYLVKVFQEGKTQIYKNTRAFPRAFFVENIVKTKDKNETVQKLFDPSINLKKTAVVADTVTTLNTSYTKGKATIITYESDKIVIQTDNTKEGFLVLSEMYYPSWHVRINTKESQIYQVDYALRGILVPAGKHIVTFYTAITL